MRNQLTLIPEKRMNIKKTSHLCSFVLHGFGRTGTKADITRR